MHQKQCLSIFFALFLGSFAAADNCPAKEQIAPCTCSNLNNDAYVVCDNLQNVTQLREALAGVKGLKLYSLEIKNSNLGDVPGSVFKGTSFEDLQLSFTKLTSIGDDENPPFAGLENSLKRLTVVEGFWDYDRPLTTPIRLDHLKKLTYLRTENNVIPKIGNEWFAKGPVTLKDLYIENSLATEVGDKVFSQLKNLRALHFTGNKVTLQRSALPENAAYLDSLDLSDNEMRELPSDICTDLPRLKYMYLNNNALEALPEDTCGRMLKQLDYLFLHSNPLDCGPKMKWIVTNKLQEKIVGTCATPKNLSGKKLEDLTIDDISG